MVTVVPITQLRKDCGSLLIHIRWLWQGQRGGIWPRGKGNAEWLFGTEGTFKALGDVEWRSLGTFNLMCKLGRAILAYGEVSSAAVGIFSSGLKGRDNVQAPAVCVCWLKKIFSRPEVSWLWLSQRPFWKNSFLYHVDILWIETIAEWCDWRWSRIAQHHLILHRLC